MNKNAEIVPCMLKKGTEPTTNKVCRRPQLRNNRINYQFGWFFVTFQVTENKSELGAIVGEKCVLNALGKAVVSLIKSLQQYNPEVFVDSFVVMPNHVHLILKIENKLSNGERHLSKIIGKLKSLAAYEYRLLRNNGLARDIGTRLWQENYWEKIISSYKQLDAIRVYVENNPKCWSMDRFGPVTAYHLGNIELLNKPFVAFVASQESRADEPVFKLERGRGTRRGTTPPHPEKRDFPHLEKRDFPHPEKRDLLYSEKMDTLQLEESFSGVLAPVISTFTSPQERAVLRRIIMKKRRFIAVYPGGLPTVLPREIAACVKSGIALLLSPVESGTGINKQRAIWCNEYVVRRAKEVWCGYIKPGGTLESILKALM